MKHRMKSITESEDTQWSYRIKIVGSKTIMNSDNQQ